MADTDSEAAAFILDELLGYMFPAALRAAAILNIADHLHDGPRSITELAESTGAAPAGLYRLLRLLATRGVFTEAEPGRFNLTSRAAALRTAAPNSVRAAVLMMTEPAMWRSAGELAESVQDGGPSFDRIFGMPFFDYYARTPAASAGFNQGMAAWSAVEDRPVAAACAIPAGATVVDVGGGHGGLLREILLLNPTAHGVLFDLEHVVAGTRLAADEGLAGRWTPAAGDFLDKIPAGDVHLLKRIAHDWDDATCVRVLTNCRRAVAPGGRILVIDAVVPAGDQPHQAKALDLLMMAVLPGHERTREQFTRLFAEAGLELASVVEVPAMAVSIIETVAASR